VNNHCSGKFWSGSGLLAARKGSCLKKISALSVLALVLVPGYQLAQGNDTPTPQTQPVNYTNVVQITPFDGVKGDLAPIVRIVSPLADSGVAPGEGKIGAGSPNGTGLLASKSTTHWVVDFGPRKPRGARRALPRLLCPRGPVRLHRKIR